MAYIYQHTQDRMDGLVTYNDKMMNKFKMSTRLVGELIERALDDKFIVMRDAKGRELYNRIIKKESE